MSRFVKHALVVLILQREREASYRFAVLRQRGCAMFIVAAKHKRFDFTTAAAPVRVPIAQGVDISRLRDPTLFARLEDVAWQAGASITFDYILAWPADDLPLQDM